MSTEAATEVTIHTDGACLGNPGPGGWAAILQSGDQERIVAGGEKLTTNQKMELRAALEGLRALRRPCRVELRSDSAYLVNCFRDGWHRNWVRNGWRTKNRQPVTNRDLWEGLLVENERHDIRWVKVKGHSGDPGNERCDTIARAEAEKFR